MQSVIVWNVVAPKLKLEPIIEKNQNGWKKCPCHLKTFYALIDISGLYYKTFRIVIYDHNDSTIVEPVL